MHPTRTVGPGQASRRVVLVGAGHAHLEAIRLAGRFRERGVELVLVAPGPFWYSGLATGMLGGVYPPELDRIDVRRLIEQGGGTFVSGCVEGIDPATQRVMLARGEPLSYDLLSLNVGSEVPAGQVPGMAEHAVLVKPIENLWQLRQALERRFEAGDPTRVVILGGGPTACELAGNIEHLASSRGGRVAITLLAGGERTLSSVPARAARVVSASLKKRGVRVETHAEVERVDDGIVRTHDERTWPFDIAVGAIGLKPPRVIAESGLPVDGEGALVVDRFLRSVGDPRIFGGGDCVALTDRKLAKIGVYAVREAPVLATNLLAAMEGKPLRVFRPQRRFLLILNLGDGTGLATWGPLSWHGRLAFRLKDWIDRRFLARYQRLARSQ